MTKYIFFKKIQSVGKPNQSKKKSQIKKLSGVKQRVIIIRKQEPCEEMQVCLYVYMWPIQLENFSYNFALIWRT